ncbi:hypothetical protein ACLOJK_032659 [Asimina triloba]
MHMTKKKIMKLEQVLCMNGGIEEASYAKNSALQRKVIAMAKPMVEEAVLEVYSRTLPRSMGIADLGCSSGPNTLLVISEVMDIIAGKCERAGRPSPEFQVYLNDLPVNDFNTVFRSLPDFYENLNKEKGDGFGPCLVSGVPGSFYGRLFPTKSLHFVHSSYCLHWRSQVLSIMNEDVGDQELINRLDLVPPGLQTVDGVALNKGNIYMSKTSPDVVFEAYLQQFNRDFSTFLKSRAEEMVTGGRMVLTLLGRKSPDPSCKECCFIWELLEQALNDMVSEGLIEEEKVDSFNLPLYTPSPQELKELVRKEGSFTIHQLLVSQVKWDVEDEDSTCDRLARGQKVGQCVRAVVESLVVTHFGDSIVEDLFTRYGVIVSKQLDEEEAKITNLSISLERKGEQEISADHEHI